MLKIFLHLSQLFLFCVTPLIANTEPPPAPVHVEPAVPEVSMPEYQGAFIKMFLTLIGLVVAIFFTIWALKRLSRGRLHQMNSHRSIKILERRPLSAKTVLYLIEVAGKQAMIAESQLEVKRILTFEDFTESEKME